MRNKDQKGSLLNYSQPTKMSYHLSESITKKNHINLAIRLTSKLSIINGKKEENVEHSTSYTSKLILSKAPTL